MSTQYIGSSNQFQFKLAEDQNSNNRVNTTQFNCLHPRVDKDNKNYESEVFGYCSCVQENVRDTIKKDNLDCNSFNNYLGLAKDNMLDNTWRFAGAAWVSSFHSNISVMNALNSVHGSGYDQCSVNELITNENGVDKMITVFKSQLANHSPEDKKILHLKKCVNEFQGLDSTKRKNLLDDRMQRLFGVNSSGFAKNIKKEYDIFSGKEKISNSCTTPAELAIIKSIPTTGQLENILSFKDKLNPEKINELYRLRFSPLGVKDDSPEGKLLSLLDNDPRLKILFTKVGNDTSEMQSKFFNIVANILQMSKSEKKFSHFETLDNFFAEEYFNTQVKRKCDDLSNELMALLCAEDKDLPLHDRNLITSIPDNYNLLGKEGKDLDQQLSRIEKSCGPESMEHGCHTLPFELAYCEAAKEKSYSPGEHGSEETFLVADNISANSHNTYFAKYVADEKFDTQQFKNLGDAFINQSDDFFGPGGMCSNIKKACGDYPIGSLQSYNCRFNVMAQSFKNEHMSQFAEYLDDCKRSTTNSCKKLTDLGIKISGGGGGGGGYDPITPTDVIVTYGDDYSDDRSDIFDTSVPENTIVKLKSGLGNEKLDLKKDEDLKFSSSSSRAQINIQKTLENLKNNDLNFSQQYSSLKNVQPAVARQIANKEQEIVKDKESIAAVDQKIKGSKSSQERELLEMERALMEKSLKEKEKSLAALKGQADRLSQLVQDLERKIANQNTVNNSNIKKPDQKNNQGDQNPQGNDRFSQSITKKIDHTNGQNVSDAQSASAGYNNLNAGRGGAGFKDQSNTDFGFNEAGAKNDSEYMEKNASNLKLQAIPMTISDLSQIQSIDQLKEVLSNYGLSDGPFYLFDKTTEKLTKVIGYKIENDTIIYEVLKDGEIHKIAGNQVKEPASRMPASIEPIQISTPQQVRKYSLEILTNILKN
jgi:predicted  nucleic acid-binding Zn-ribbon protein